MRAGKDFYEILGVPKTATPDEIQRSYRKLARTYHPDINKSPDAEERFKEISEAYDVLSDPDQRRRYDNPRESSSADEQWTPDQPWTSYRTSAASDIDFDELFGGLFTGGGRAGRGRRPLQGADQEAELALTVEEAYHGGTRTLTLPAPDGRRTLDVTIPAGVIDGQRIRLKEQGGRGSGGARAGDLYLIVRLAPHPRYRVEGRDIYVDLPLAPWEAALGAHVAVDTPGGEAKIRVPAGSSSGRRLRLRNRGMPRPGGSAGDLYAEVRIVVPRSLSKDERR
ncbi:MAG: curved DNA-binding protein, partial [Actinomycetota bacterium]|nr:curved DNA-binding protein [Actinomycetota bacterium]